MGLALKLMMWGLTPKLTRMWGLAPKLIWASPQADMGLALKLMM